MRPIWWFATQLWVTLAWVFFRDPQLQSALAYFAALEPNGLESLKVHSELWIGFVFAGGAVLQQILQLVTFRHRRCAPEILGATTVLAFLSYLIVLSPDKAFIYFMF